MGYKEILEEIQAKAERADKIAAEVYQGSKRHGYGRGDFNGIDTDVVTFQYRACNCCGPDYYYIPLYWLEKSEDELEDYLLLTRKEAEEKEMLDQEREKIAIKLEAEKKRREQYEKLKAEFESSIS